MLRMLSIGLHEMSFITGIELLEVPCRGGIRRHGGAEYVMVCGEA